MRTSYTILLFLSTIFLLTSCNSLPNHAKLIPADAIVVAGIHTGQIGKKIAWNAILGSKLFEEMKKKQSSKGQIEIDPQQMGIELMGSSYVYIKADKRFSNGNRVTALIPLESMERWEAYVKRTFRTAGIVEKKDHKEAALAEGMYVGWNKELLIIMNTLASEPSITWESNTGDTTLQIAPPLKMDTALLVAEMNNAFHVNESNAITENKSFSSFEKKGHDITLWINYDVLMSQYGNSGIGGAMGFSLSNKLWKDAVLTAGFDFEKGKIAGDFHYYMSDEMKEVGKEMAEKNIDKEMFDRLPKKNLDMIMGWHLSPQGLKGTLEKMGVLGFINLALSGQDLSADYILEAFTGDMVVSLNDFKLTPRKDSMSLAGKATDSAINMSVSSNMNYTYAIKINKKENFNKLLNMGVSMGLLSPNGTNMYLFGSKQALLVSEQYCILASNNETALDYQSGKNKGGKLPEHVEEITRNPFGIYFDAQGVMNNITPGTVHSSKDSAMIAESKKLLQDIIFKGGGFKNNAFEYNMAINFINKEENSILLLTDFAMKLNTAEQQDLAAKN